jgi:predicted regulator of Ras-like GTPase activity (Roadblock/LC7/MglB family)
VSAFSDVVADLRADIDGIRRVLFCSSDGLPIADTLDDATNGSSAATAATILGLGRHTATMLGDGAFTEAVIRSTDGCLVVYGIGGEHVLAVYCTAEVNVTMLDRKVGRLKAQFDPVSAGV